jgi:hypothetical protein
MSLNERDHLISELMWTGRRFDKAIEHVYGTMSDPDHVAHLHTHLRAKRKAEDLKPHVDRSRLFKAYLQKRADNDPLHEDRP